VPSQTMLYLANPGGPASNTQEVSSSSALSAELRAMAAKGQLGNGSAGHRQQIKRLYDSANFAPLWTNGDQPTSQATYLIETLRASRLKGLNASDYDAEGPATKSSSLKGASAAAQASFDAL
jgi:L,D-transpeptidase YcbB